MNRRIPSLAAVAAFIACLTPAVSHAGLPDPSNSTIPAHVVLVGRDPSGSADPMGQMTVVIRDLANNPMPGALVRMQFSNASDTRPSLAQPDPAITGVSCDGARTTFTMLTGPDGAVRFSLVGIGVLSAASPPQYPTLTFYWDQAYLGAVKVAALDEDGGGGVAPADQSQFLMDFFSSQYWPRSDFDGNGALGANDLSQWLGAFFASNSIQSGGASCP